MAGVSGWPLADDLSETMRECLFHYPKGHFGAATIRALRTRGLILPRGRSPSGDRVVVYLQGKAGQ